VAFRFAQIIIIEENRSTPPKMANAESNRSLTLSPSSRTRI